MSSPSTTRKTFSKQDSTTVSSSPTFRNTFSKNAFNLCPDALSMASESLKSYLPEGRSEKSRSTTPPEQSSPSRRTTSSFSNAYLNGTLPRTTPEYAETIQLTPTFFFPTIKPETPSSVILKVPSSLPVTLTERLGLRSTGCTKSNECVSPVGSVTFTSI